MWWVLAVFPTRPLSQRQGIVSFVALPSSFCSPTGQGQRAACFKQQEQVRTANHDRQDIGG